LCHSFWFAIFIFKLKIQNSFFCCMAILHCSLNKEV
jgi:hypothetical protein